MLEKDLVLGIDTSNYTTSLGLTDKYGDIVVDFRKSLIVKQGEKGLRQSYALFQHIENLPEMILGLFQEIDKNRIAAIAASNRPRPVDGSYMPVFKAGVNYSKVLAASLGVPFFEFSHQEGHLEAAKHGSVLSGENEYLSYHLSGGTSELLYIKSNEIKIIGASKDISFGQTIDRIGVALNLGFPAGAEMDKMAVSYDIQRETSKKFECLLKKIPIDGLYFNLSGIESQCQRALDKGNKQPELVYELFLKISQCLCNLTEKAVSSYNCKKVLFAGGVSASSFIRSHIKDHFSNMGVVIEFSPPELSSDNGVGISWLGGKCLWQ